MYIFSRDLIYSCKSIQKANVRAGWEIVSYRIEKWHSKGKLTILNHRTSLETITVKTKTPNQLR